MGTNLLNPTRVSANAVTSRLGIGAGRHGPSAPITGPRCFTLYEDVRRGELNQCLPVPRRPPLNLLSMPLSLSPEMIKHCSMISTPTARMYYLGW